MIANEEKAPSMDTLQTSLPLIANPWEGYQSRYVAYCLAHGAASPDEMLARDTLAWPGGKMCGYILWISEKWREWRSLTGYKAESLSIEHHASFDEMLRTGQEEPAL